MKPRRRRPQKFAQVYSYDRFGNRTIDAAQTWGVGSYNKQFTVNTANNRLGVPAGQSGLMSYDNAGNLTTDTYSGGGDRTFDAENRMTKAWENNQWQVYTYNADGQRVRRKVEGVETWQVYGMDGELVAEYAANVSAATPQKEYGYRNGQLLITTGTAPSSGVTEPAVWSNAVGVSPSGNNLTKTATTGWGNAGAASTRALALGDGYVEFTASETNTARMCGLSNGDSNQDWQDIDFGMYPVGDGGLHVYEGGIYRGVIGSYAAGDRLRVAVEGGVVKYRKNGVLLYTSTVAPTYPLLVDTAIYSNGGTLNNVVISGSLTGGSGATAAEINWLVADQLGTPRMVFDQTGSLAATKRHDYLPFGEELFAGMGGRTPEQGYSGDSIRQKFTSYERDNETGLDYAKARVYASTQGRFTSVDPLTASATTGNPQTFNRYTYALNAPTNFTDPSGMLSMDMTSACGQFCQNDD